MVQALRPSSRSFSFLGLSALLLSLAFGGDSERPKLAPVSDVLRGAMMRGDWVGARAELTRLEGVAPQYADMWAYVDALALAAGGEREKALERLNGLLVEHAASPWVHKARFETAEIERALGHDDRAEGIFEAEAERLRAGDRQRELARIYLDFADVLSTVESAPSAEPRKLDYARAAALYTAVLELEAPRDLVDWTMWRIGHCQEQLGEFENALASHEGYLARFDPTRADASAAREGAGVHVFEARAGRARALQALGRAREARAGYEDLQAAYELALAGGGGWGSAFAGFTAEQREAARAAYEASFLAVAGTWSKGDVLQGPLAIRALERFVAKFPSHRRAAGAAFAIGEQYQALNRSADARAAFHALRALAAPATDDPRTLEADAALRQQAIFLEASIAAAQGEHAAARELYEEYVRRFPTGAQWADAQQGILDVEFAVGERARARSEWKEARAAWTSFLEAHPLDARARGLAYEIGELWRAEAGAARERARELGRLEAEKPALEALFREALAQYARVVSKYPGSEEASAALYQTGFVLETELDDLEGAIAAYRTCNYGSHTANASARLEQLVKPSLALITERTARSDEAAAVRLQIRNVEQVEVKLFALDLEAYFRKHLSNQNVEALDLDLIAADRSLEVPIDHYRPYAPLEQVVELPVEGAGVWAVTVSTEKERATTLVVRSDIELVVESTRREALAFVEDVRAGKAVEGARVLLVTLPGTNDAVPQFHELVTGADGVARLAAADLEGAREVRALAVHDGHFASQGLDLSPIGLGAGLSPREYVYTDRSAYRPGQLVHWRAILRQVKDNAFTFEEGQSYRVEISDPAGRTLSEERSALSAFGTLAGSVMLPEEAASGSWTISLEDKSGRRGSGSFLVEDYHLQRAELVLTPERDVYYRGERVELAVEARWYWGEPIAQARVAYWTPDGAQGELVTDAEGRGHLSFDTRELLQPGAYGFLASLMEQGVGSDAVIQLATLGYQAKLSIARSFVLAGESFTVTLATEGPDGKPIGTAMQLAILGRESNHEGGWAEIEVARHALQTDAKRGAAKLTTSIEKGGAYILRAQGDDRFGNPVVAEIPLWVSGEEDAVRLRFLVDDAEVDVGEKRSLELFNRAGKGLALLTFHAEKLLEYRVLELAEGSNRIELAIENAHFPAFTATVAAIRGTHLHQASTDFTVQRHLAVRILPAAASVPPGAETSIELLVADQLGRPVSAELSLAVVDAALYELFPDPAPPLEKHFDAPNARSTAISVASSCGFRYEGRTCAISDEILAEAEREQRAAQLGLIAQSASDVFYRGPGDSPAPSTPGPAAAEDELARGELSAYASKAAGGEGGGGASNSSRRLGAGKRVGKKLEDEEDKGRNLGEASRPRISSETAFFAPAIVTDAEGRATVRFTMPEKSTRWRLTCRGVSKETLLGEAQAGIVSRAEFQVVLETPAVLTEGDAPRLVARIHKSAGSTGTAELRLRVRGGEKEVVLPASIELPSGASTEYTFPPVAVGPVGASDALTFELEVDAKLGTETLQRTVSEDVVVRPWGLEESVAKSGVLTSEQTLELALPEGSSWRERELELHLGANVERLLLDEALGGGARADLRHIPLSDTIADTSAMLIGDLAVLEALGRTGRSVVAEARELRARASALVSRLIASQGANGAWSAAGREGTSLVPATAVATRALAIARAAGLAVPPASLEAAANFLRASFSGSSASSDETRAMAAAALAAFDQASFEHISRLHRDRASLSIVAQAYLALALVDMQRAPMAREVAEALAERAAAAASGGTAWSAADNTPWNRCEIETSALVVLALERALPTSPRIAEGVAHLLAARPWYPVRARGMALAAIARYQAETEPARERVRVRVEVEGLDDRTLDLDPDRPGFSVRIAVPDAAPRTVRVKLRLEGRGSPSFGAVLSGFTTEVVARGDARGRSGARGLRYDYYAPPPLYRGKELSEGFSVLTHFERPWTNPLRTLELGRTTNVTVDVITPSSNAGPEGRSDWAVLELPLPAGTSLLEGSLQGEILAWREEAGRLVLQLGGLEGWHQLRYTLVGTLPGKWRPLPPTLWRAFDPGILAVGEPIGFEVLARGERSTEARRPTPDELYSLGTRAWEQGDHELAAATLASLWETFGNRLGQDPARETVHILFLASIERNDTRSTVQFFELLKERYPELTIPFDKVFAVGRAYRALEDHERATLVFRAIIEETFGKDLKVVGTLESQQELAGALEVLERLWLEYPDLPSVVETQLAYADKLFEYARSETLWPSLRRAGFDRGRLAGTGLRSLERFLTLYSHDPLAPEAALGLVSAELELEHHERAAALADEMAPLYAEPRYQDAFRYSRAVALWYVGKDDAALELLEGIAVGTWTDAAGIEHPSANRDLALYILGQIHHARRESKSASEYYERVANLFVDAREALAGFRERVLSLEEVTTARPGEKIELAITHKNLAHAELLVYGVDLMTLTLREKNLSRVTAVNLAGIAPTLKTTVELPATDPLRPSETKVELALAEPGAYLVICRGGDLFASGLVLVSDIELEVSEEPAAGRVRVEVLDAADGHYLRGVDVRVIGSANANFLSGKTDPRGLYVAEGVQGASTVIAREGERHYAFHRGREIVVADAALYPERQSLEKDQDYLHNVLELNAGNFRYRQQRLQEEIERDRGGVQLKQLK